MKTAVFSTKPHDRETLPSENSSHTFTFFENVLRPETAALASGHEAVCAFVNDDLSASTLEILAENAVRLIVLRCAGFNNVDLPAAKRYGLTVLRVPEYSPYAVAEHTLALLLCLNRHIHKAYTRVRDGNFALKGLLGFDLHGKTIGVIGTGKIGLIFVQLLSGFGMEVLAYDPHQNPEAVKAGAAYVPLPILFEKSDIISLHCPLTPETHHLIDTNSLDSCKRGLFLINTSRGGLLDTAAAVSHLKSGHLGGLALDVYEEESGIFFEDLAGTIIDDDILMRLTTFPNVLITAHQAFFTAEALANIADTTHQNLSAFENGDQLENEVS